MFFFIQYIWFTCFRIQIENSLSRCIMVMLIWEENAHKCNENSVAMQKHLLKTGQMPYWWDLTAFVWKSILLCFLQDTAVSALLRRTSPMIPSVWTTASVWRESASRSVKLWRTCSRVLAMVSWPADNANTVSTWQLQFLESVLSKHELFTFPVSHFSETNSSCKVCCRYKNAVCAPYVSDKGNHLYLRKGKPCTVGFVMERCEPTYSYSYEKTYIKAVLFTDQLQYSQDN